MPRLSDLERSGLQLCEIEPRASREAWIESGFNPDFIVDIIRAAALHNTIISIRKNSFKYTNLLSWKYVTKSMAIHAKTCSWGPMTGFVCLDPRLHKGHIRSEAFKKSQIRALNESLTPSSHQLRRVIPLMIPGQRIVELLNHGVKDGSISCLNVPAPSQGEGFQLPEDRNTNLIIQATCPMDDLDSVTSTKVLRGPEMFQFNLIPVDSGYPMADEYNLYYVCWSSDTEDGRFFPEVIHSLFQETPPECHQGLNAIRTQLSRVFPTIPPECVLAVVDPSSPYTDHDFRNATTGDYDLFSIHPLLSAYIGECHPHRDEAEHTEQKSSWEMSFHERMKERRAASELPRPPSANAIRFPHNATNYSVECPAHTTVSPLVGPSSPTRDPAFSISAHATQGALSHHESHLLSSLNELIGYHKGIHPESFSGNPEDLRLFHHGPEAHNPHTDKPDLPFVAVLPCEQHLENGVPKCFRGVLISNIIQLNAFYVWRVAMCGYAITPGVNPAWHKVMTDAATHKALMPKYPETFGKDLVPFRSQGRSPSSLGKQIPPLSSQRQSQNFYNIIQRLIKGADAPSHHVICARTVLSFLNMEKELFENARNLQITAREVWND